MGRGDSTCEIYFIISVGMLPMGSTRRAIFECLTCNLCHIKVECVNAYPCIIISLCRSFQQQMSQINKEEKIYSKVYLFIICKVEILYISCKTIQNLVNVFLDQFICKRAQQNHHFSCPIYSSSHEVFPDAVRKNKN